MFRGDRIWLFCNLGRRGPGRGVTNLWSEGVWAWLIPFLGEFVVNRWSGEDCLRIPCGCGIYILDGFLNRISWEKKTTLAQRAKDDLWENHWLTQIKSKKDKHMSYDYTLLLLMELLQNRFNHEVFFSPLDRLTRSLRRQITPTSTDNNGQRHNISTGSRWISPISTFVVNRGERDERVRRSRGESKLHG